MRSLSRRSKVLTVALVLGIGPTACGRTGLDDDFAPAHASGGAPGSAGGVGAGMAGRGGSGGVAGVAGQAGAPTGFGGAGGAMPAVCLEGARSCTGSNAAQICMGGAWQPSFFCPVACSNGFCVECSPGTTSCISDTELVVCTAPGLFGPPLTCPGSCRNDACSPVATTGQGGAGGTAPPACIEGTTTCSGPTTAQNCLDGRWQPAFSCAVGCLNGVCTECVPGTGMCVSATEIELCGTAGIYGPRTPCVGGCQNGACAQSRKTVFVTSLTFTSAFGGLAGADVRCQKVADAGALPGTYRAWLSDSTGSPSTRFTKNGAPYALVDGTVVANDWNDLTSGMLRHAIDRTEQGSPAPMGTADCVGPSVWSDTTAQGTLADPTYSCRDWTGPILAGQSLVVFGTSASTSAWSQACTLLEGNADHACGAQAALFCFEQ